MSYGYPDEEDLYDDGDFRDFIVWMCGITDATEAPNQEAWAKVRDKVKDIAGKYALARRDRHKSRMEAEMYKRQLELDLQNHMHTVQAAKLSQPYWSDNASSTSGLVSTSTTDYTTDVCLTGSGISAAKF